MSYRRTALWSGIFLLLLGAGSASAVNEVEALPLNEIKLLPSPFEERQKLHQTGYVASLDPDKMLFDYRKVAKLPQPTEVTRSYGGWDGGFIRGHMAGHYLSAASRLYAATGDTAFRDKANYIVKVMGDCQNAIGTGHLAAFPESVLDAFDKNGQGSQGIAVPYYTIHKILAGLNDAYRYLGNKEALDIAQKMSDRYAARMAAMSPEQIDMVLHTDRGRNPNNEFGGMSDALTELAELSGDKRHLKLARIFIRDWFTQPLANGEDRLTNLHGNTHVAQAVGIARYANTTGDPELVKASENFWELITGTRSFVIGGNSFKEWLDKPGVETGPSIYENRSLPYNTAETCNTNNMLKLTLQLFERQPDIAKADFFERALYNHILASIAPDTGRMTYFLPMHGDFRMYLDGTECCVGSGIENTGRYGEGIYFQHESKLWVNLYIPSQLDWKEQGIVLQQEGNIPFTNKVKVSIIKASGRKAALKLRVPSWVASPPALSINGKSTPLPKINAGYIELAQTWAKGDTVELTFPIALRVERAKDDPKMTSVFYGPLLLAMRMGKEGMQSDIGDKDRPKNMPDVEVPIIIGDQNHPEKWLKLIDPSKLAFEAVECGPATGKTFEPLMSVHHERYSVYIPVLTKEESSVTTHYSASSSKPKDPNIVDEVIPGNTASETAHDFSSEKSKTGIGPQGRPWRDAEPDGWFSYTMAIAPGQALDLVCDYWGGDTGRTFEVVANGQKVGTQKLGNGPKDQYFSVTYPIPESALNGQQNIAIRIQGIGNGRAGGVFGIRVIKRAAP